jgi:hypothetical protein
VLSGCSRLDHVATATTCHTLQELLPCCLCLLRHSVNGLQQTCQLHVGAHLRRGTAGICGHEPRLAGAAAGTAADSICKPRRPQLQLLQAARACGRLLLSWLQSVPLQHHCQAAWRGARGSHHAMPCMLHACTGTGAWQTGCPAPSSVGLPAGDCIHVLRAEARTCLPATP